MEERREESVWDGISANGESCWYGNENGSEIVGSALARVASASKVLSARAEWVSSSLPSPFPSPPRRHALARCVIVGDLYYYY